MVNFIVLKIVIGETVSNGSFTLEKCRSKLRKPHRTTIIMTANRPVLCKNAITGICFIKIR